LQNISPPNPQKWQNSQYLAWRHNMDTVIYIDPNTGYVDQMPIAMIAAYVPYAEYLNFEEAAHMAHICDVDAAINLLLSIDETIPEGTSLDVLSVESPSLR